MKFEFDFQLGEQLRSAQVANGRIFSAARRLLVFAIVIGLSVMTVFITAGAALLIGEILLLFRLIPELYMDILNAWLPFIGFAGGMLALFFVWPKLAMKFSGFLFSVRRRDGEEVVVEAAEDALYWSGPASRAIIGWKDIEHVVADRAAITFVYGLGCCYVPLRAIGDAEAVTAFLDLVEERRQGASA